MSRIGSIYIIQNTVDQKVYVGSTIRKAYRRHAEHWYKLRTNSHGNAHLQNAWNKYGEESFIFQVIELTDENSLKKAEQDACLRFKSLNSEFGYNKTFPESGLKILSSFRAEQLRKRCIETPLHKGFSHSNEAKQRMSLAKKGKYQGERNPNYGRKWTPEMKLAAAARAEKIWELRRGAK